ncbi:hypothetical protein GUJ93_ZPchr0009g2017 [Zizania palustris]|uniref:Uncharacterized protein n=1 Tax=Zizania palustris TaxID=103762 RepID=A0A8J5R9E4_ZIZPA|nr:hypothetical protein GUJ93_ZPchr0009g2017 [Zizania palustris]
MRTTHNLISKGRSDQAEIIFPGNDDGWYIDCSAATAESVVDGDSCSVDLTGNLSTSTISIDAVGPYRFISQFGWLSVHAPVEVTCHMAKPTPPYRCHRPAADITLPLASPITKVGTTLLPTSPLTSAGVPDRWLAHRLGGHAQAGVAPCFAALRLASPHAQVAVPMLKKKKTGERKKNRKEERKKENEERKGKKRK